MPRKSDIPAAITESETIIASLTQERDALRADLERLRAKLEVTRAQHADVEALLASTTSALARSESDVDGGRAERDALRPRYEHLVALDLRLRALARSRGLID